MYAHHHSAVLAEWLGALIARRSTRVQVRVVSFFFFLKFACVQWYVHAIVMAIAAIANSKSGLRHCVAMQWPAMAIGPMTIGNAHTMPMAIANVKKPFAMAIE